MYICIYIYPHGIPISIKDVAKSHSVRQSAHRRGHREAAAGSGPNGPNAESAHAQQGETGLRFGGPRRVQSLGNTRLILVLLILVC